MSASLSPGNFGRDENEWFGGRDQDAEEAASKSLAATAARIVGAKPFPVAAKRLEELTRTNSARIEQVVVVLESDPALSARLLRLVNSAGYGLKVRCTSVRHAAVLVGTRRLNQVATTAAILDLFESSNTLAAELLEHAAIVGSLCRYLAVHLGLPHDELFTCGFLHDIGKIMLLDTERDTYPGLLREFGGNPDSVHEQERRVFGFDHATLGAHVLTAWNIPEPVPKVIAWHHQPARALQDSLLSAMVQTLRLADMLAYELGRRGDEEGIRLVAASEAAQYLDISEPQLASMWRDLAGLRERSKARSHGEPELEAADPRLDVPQSLRPRASMSPRTGKTSLAPTQGTLVPTDSDPPGTSRAAGESQSNEVPSKLACVVCGTGSYGNICQACGGHVCPEHQTGVEEWCALCQDDFIEFKTGYRLPPSALTVVGTAVGVSLLGAALSAWTSGNTGFSALLAPLLMIVVWAMVLPIGYRLWVKLRFMRGLTPRVPPRVAADTGGRATEGEGQELNLTGQGALPATPSLVPSYERTTQHGSLAPPIEPFAAGLAAMMSGSTESAPRPESTARPASSEPPVSNRPMVIRVDVPSLQPLAMGAASLGDGQLSAMARQVGPSVVPPRDDDSSEGHVSSVMPTAPTSGSAQRVIRTPASMVPTSDGLGAQVSLAMRDLRDARGVIEIEHKPTMAPRLIPSAAPPAAEPRVEEVKVLGPPEDFSVVRLAFQRNEAGVVREVCSPFVLNSCS